MWGSASYPLNVAYILAWDSSINMSSIYCPNTILHEHPTFICYKICIQICRNNLQAVWLVHYLKIWVPSWVVAYLKWCLIRWSFNHVLPKFANSIQDLFEISMHYLYRPPPVLVNNSKVLVMANNMKKHCYLLFYTTMQAIYEQVPFSKQLA